MILIAQAHFSKYKKSNSNSDKINVINVLKSNKSIPVEYVIIAEFSLTKSEVEHILKVGSLKDYPKILDSCLLSTTNTEGHWQCILINNSLLLYTAGCADIMYYSFK